MNEKPNEIAFDVDVNYISSRPELRVDTSIQLRPIQNKILKEVLEIPGVDSFSYINDNKDFFSNHNFDIQISKLFRVEAVALSIIAKTIEAYLSSWSPTEIEKCTIFVKITDEKPPKIEKEFSNINELLQYIQNDVNNSLIH